MSFDRAVKLPDVTEPVDSRDLRKTGIHPDYWYPLARSHQLKPGKALGVSFAGEPIVLVRTKSGRLFALEDRCAHRQIPLHAGVVCGEHLQCCYHCWTYDETGKCINVPYLDQDKSLLRGVHSYPCREAYGLIFVFPGDSNKHHVVPFPEIPLQADRKYKTRYVERQVRCHYSFMHENLMDMNHQFLHRRLMGRIETILLTYRCGENWVEADYMLNSMVGQSPLGKKLIVGKSQSQLEKQPRDMTIRTQYPYQTLQVWVGEGGPPALDLWTAYVPIDREQRINHSFGLVMVRKPSIPGAIHALWPLIVWFTESIFAEDRWVVEQEQQAFDLQGADWNQEIFPVMCELRRLLRRQGVPLQGNIAPPCNGGVPLTS